METTDSIMETVKKNQNSKLYNSFQGEKNSIDNSRVVQDHFGTRLEKQINLRFGASLFIKNLYYQKDYIEKFESESDMFSFWFCCSGNKKSTISGMRDDFVMSSGLSGIFMGQKGYNGYSKFQAHKPWQIVSIHIDPSSLSDLIGKGYDKLPKACRFLAEGKDSGCFGHSMLMTPGIRVAVDQILNCSFEDSNRLLYYEGKVLEIIACLLEDIRNFEHKSKRIFLLCPADIERIHYARELLMADIINPPGLIDLARSAGMHHTKLNKGFREVFGNTVFGHLREIRLEKASHLLKTGNMNSAEVAFTVGYSSLSHFAKAFRKQYGARPGSYLRRISPVRANKE